MHILLDFKTSCFNLKSDAREQTCALLFYYLELMKEKSGHILYLLFCPEGFFLRFVFYLNE